MFINPKTAIEQGWVKFPDWMTKEQQDKCIQPNALDFDIDRVFAFKSEANPFMLSEHDKLMRPTVEISPTSDDAGQWWYLPANSVTDFSSSFYVTIPEGVAAMLIVRSTLNRNGLFITSGLYDATFKGMIAGCIHNRGPEATIAKGTRIGQIIFIKSEFSGVAYSGNYNTLQGQHWTEI